MKYVIDSETYEKHIRDEVHLYGLLHQLAFLAGKVNKAVRIHRKSRDNRAEAEDKDKYHRKYSLFHCYPSFTVFLQNAEATQCRRRQR